MEVGEVVGSRQPGWHLVLEGVGLGREVLTLDEAAEGLGVSEVLPHRGGGCDAGTQLPLVVAAGEVVHLTGSLVEAAWRGALVEAVSKYILIL
jgi:hypothetical protein